MMTILTKLILMGDRYYDDCKVKDKISNFSLTSYSNVTSILLSWHLQTILHVCEMNATRRKMKVMVLRCQEGYPHPLVPSSSITTKPSTHDN